MTTNQSVADNDALHILPLSILSLQTTGLKSARIIKNSQMDGVVELFSEEGSGSGQIYPRDLKQFFDFSGGRETDFDVINVLCDLPSYDVYSLRISLRESGIPIAKGGKLELSKEKVAQLSSYMQIFTRPLVAAVYGDDSATDRSFSDILKLFLDPNVKSARQNLLNLAHSLGVDLMEIPAFLERYGDVYLSLAYYGQCLETIIPKMRSLSAAMADLKASPQYQSNAQFAKTCNLIEERMSAAEASIRRVLDIFMVMTQDMWEEISPSEFRDIRELIVSYQRDIGSSLCALTVKTISWDNLKAKNNPSVFAGFIMSDLIKGIERVADIDFNETLH